MVRVSPRSEFDQTRRSNREKHEQKRDGRYLEATRDVLQKHAGLWFQNESYVISRHRFAG